MLSPAVFWFLAWQRSISQRDNDSRYAKFHKHFFMLPKSGPSPPTRNTIVSPHVRMLGPDHALVVYVRVTQSGGTVSSANETRLWKRMGGSWKNVHFHRSKL